MSRYWIVIVAREWEGMTVVSPTGVRSPVQVDNSDAGKWWMPVFDDERQAYALAMQHGCQVMPFDFDGDAAPPDEVEN